MASASNFGSDTTSQFGIPLEAEFSSCLYGASLHRTLHYQLSIVLIWLKNVERGVKHQIIIILINNKANDFDVW